MLTPNLVKIGQLSQELNVVETQIHTETKWRSHRDKMAISHRDKMAVTQRQNGDLTQRQNDGHT